MRYPSVLPLAGYHLGDDGEGVLAIDCPVHARRVLVPPSRIRSLSNTATGIVVVVECWCGAVVRLRTGRARPLSVTRS
ncbi:MAG: hypothetical protein FWJ70_07410 [Micromonosporaceae bacterium]